MPPNIVLDVFNFISIAQPEMMQQPEVRPDKKVLELAYKLIDEEVNKELLPRLQQMIDGSHSLELSASLLDDIVDTVYVSAWAAIVLQLPFNAAWHKVQEANMAKFPILQGSLLGPQEIKELQPDGSTVSIERGRVIFQNTETGKVMKPTNWKPADIWSVLYDCWTKIKLQTHEEIMAGSRYLNDQFRGHRNGGNGELK